MPTVTRKSVFSVWPNHVIFNGKGRHACKYRATKYGSLLFIGLPTKYLCENSGNMLIIFRASTERKRNCNVAKRNQ